MKTGPHAPGKVWNVEEEEEPPRVGGGCPLSALSLGGFRRL